MAGGGVVVGGTDLRPPLIDMALTWAAKESLRPGSNVPSRPSSE